jgi:3-phenylpropionate/trans-cinnamate dioxygenase ferredoxin subunit
MTTSLEGYLPTVPLTDLQLNRPKRVKTPNGFVVLALSQDESGQTVSAFTPICPHAMGDLSYGMVYKGEIECPVHGYRFDLKTGACTHPDDESPMQVYAVQIVDGVVHVKLEKPKWMKD